MESFGVASVCREGGVFIYHRLDLNKDCVVAYGVGVLQDCVDSVLVKMLCGWVRREIFSVKKKSTIFLYSWWTKWMIKGGWRLGLW